jgi:hypothetical protein
LPKYVYNDTLHDLDPAKKLKQIDKYNINNPDSNTYLRKLISPIVAPMNVLSYIDTVIAEREYDSFSIDTINTKIKTLNDDYEMSI